MKKLYFLIAITLIAGSVSFGQTQIFNVAGGGAFPTGWTSNNAIASNDIDRSSYYLVETDGTNYDVITTNVIDLSSYGSATFDIDVATFGSGTNNPAKIEISFDGGSTFTQTEVTATPTSSTYIAGGTITLNSVTSQVQIRISNNGASNKGVRLRNLVLTAFASTPFVQVTAPSDMAVFPSGTTSVDVEFNTGNTTAGDQVNITINGTPNLNVTSPFSITTANGQSYTVLVELVDSGSSVLDSETVTFEVLFPCDLILGTITEACDAETAAVDTYTTSIAFTGGGGTTYTINTGGVGTVGGDDPSSVASGTITVSGVNEGTNFTVTVTGDASNSSCDISRDITSPICFTPVCANAGDIIMTEIMPNPAAVADSNGEYFELYNTTTASIDIQGWIIKDDASASETHTIGSSLVIAANSYIVLGNAATLNGGITLDYTYSDISLGNSGTDGLILECAGTMIDQVIWDGSFPYASGVSMELSVTTLNATSNDSATNWGAAITTYGDGDKGTPGATNDFTLSTATSKIETFNIYPNPTSLGYVSIDSRNNSKIEVTVFDILGKRVLKNTVKNNTLDVSHLKTGMYIMRMSQDGASVTKKLVIQ